MTDKPHEAYIDTVAAALSASGFEVEDWWADLNDPLDGWIELKPVGVYDGTDEFGLGWSEDRGWFVLTIDDPHGRDSRNVFDLLVGVVASPETVVRTFAGMAGVEASVPGDNYPDLPFDGHSFEDDDPEFEAALAAYGSADR